MIFPLLLFSQNSWQGNITDPQNHPVPYVVIRNFSKQYQSFSDENGAFFLPREFEKGDTIIFTRIGFREKQILLPEENSILNISLLPITLKLNSVQIEGYYSEDYLRGNDFQKLSKPAGLRDSEHRHILSAISGAYIRSYGGSAGVSSLSLDGAPSTQTKILVSGFDLTNAQNGQMDISQLPAPFIENIYYSPQSNSDPGNKNSEGCVYLNPWSGNNSLTVSKGSFGHQAIHSCLNYQKENWVGNLLIGKRHNSGDYPAVNPITGVEKNRKNNHIDQEFISMRLNGCIRENRFIRILFLQSGQERGVAGQIWSPTPNSYRKDQLKIGGIKYGWINKTGHGYVQSLIRNSNEHYVNKPDFGFPVNSRHDLTTYQVQARQFMNINDRMKFDLLLSGKDDRLHSKKSGNFSRQSFEASLGIPLIPNKYLHFNPVCRYNYSPDLYSEYTYDLSFSIPLELPWWQSLHIFYGRFFRFPTFNDMYWEPGGDPDLKPEYTDNLSAQFTINPLPCLAVKAFIYNKNSENLIQWMPGQGYWQPKNIRKTNRHGYKLIFNYRSEAIPLNAMFHFSKNISRDKTPGDYFNKPLRYAPEYSAAFNINFQPGNFGIFFQGHYTDSRIAMYSWPEDIVLPEFAELSCSFSYTLQASGGEFIFASRIDNFTNEKYETIKGYPEPGRSFRFTITFLLKNNELKEREKINSAKQ